MIEPLQLKDYHVLRYNSRGVGSSSGWGSLTGFNEAKDLEALLFWAIEHLSNIQVVALIVSIQPTERYHTCLH